MLAYVEVHHDKSSAERIIFGLRQMQPVFTGMKMIQITGQHIRGYVRTRQERGVTTDTIRQRWVFFQLRAIWCIRELEWNIANPVSGRLPAIGEGRVRCITRVEAMELLNAAKQQLKAPHLADFIRLALHTGMRRGELLGLEWSRVDFHQALLYLDPPHQKNRRRGSVPLNREATAALVNRARWHATHYQASELLRHSDIRITMR